MKSTDNLYTFINFLAFDTAPGFSKRSFLLARNLYHVIFYCSSITLEFKFKRWCTECYISYTKCNVQITLEVNHTMFNFGKGWIGGGGGIFHIIIIWCSTSERVGWGGWGYLPYYKSFDAYEQKWVHVLWDNFIVFNKKMLR